MELTGFSDAQLLKASIWVISALFGLFLTAITLYLKEILGQFKTLILEYRVMGAELLNVAKESADNKQDIEEIKGNINDINRTQMEHDVIITDLRRKKQA